MRRIEKDAYIHDGTRIVWEVLRARLQVLEVAHEERHLHGILQSLRTLRLHEYQQIEDIVIRT